MSGKKSPSVALERHYSLSAAASLLGCSKRTIERLVVRREISRVVYVTARKPVIPASSLAEFVQHRSVVSEA